jgi:integrase
LDRWGFPLGLATVLRLEEIAGLRREDLMHLNGITALRVRPHENRRLKNEASPRYVPVPIDLI